MEIGEDLGHLLKQDDVRVPAEELRDDSLAEVNASVPGRGQGQGVADSDSLGTDRRYLHRRRAPSTPYFWSFTRDWARMLYETTLT